MRVASLWRYPVKSLTAEPLPAAELTADGVASDRTPTSATAAAT